MREVVKEVRLKALEELRQRLKYEIWPIGCLAMVEQAVAELSEKEPDKRYAKFFQQYQD